MVEEKRWLKRFIRIIRHSMSVKNVALPMNRKSGRRNASSGANSIKAVTWKLPSTASPWNELAELQAWLNLWKNLTIDF